MDGSAMPIRALSWANLRCRGRHSSILSRDFARGVRGRPIGEDAHNRRKAHSHGSSRERTLQNIDAARSVAVRGGELLGDFELTDGPVDQSLGVVQTGESASQRAFRGVDIRIAWLRETADHAIVFTTSLT
jgi:hypothetical protein